MLQLNWYDMNAMIIDNEPAGIGELSRMLEQYCPQVHVLATCNSALQAEQRLKEVSPELVFLDIQMPCKSGLKLLTELPVRQFEVIFVTAHSEYMLQALQYSAADYLLKPVDEHKLIEAVNRVAKKLAQPAMRRTDMLVHNILHAGIPADMRLCIPSLKGFMIVKLEEIIYCEAERSYTIFHLVNGKAITVSKPLVDYDHLLSNAEFFRIHKSFLINMLHVKEYQRGEGGTVVMSNGAGIEVSRRRKEVFLEKLRSGCLY
jgi:two-component system, LytTR family, response regulator